MAAGLAKEKNKSLCSDRSTFRREMHGSRGLGHPIPRNHPHAGTRWKGVGGRLEACAPLEDGGRKSHGVDCLPSFSGRQRPAQILQPEGRVAISDWSGFATCSLCDSGK